MADANSETDETKEEISFDFVDYTFILIGLIMLVVGIVGNAAVVFIALCRRSMWTMMNIFLTNLAIGNFFFILFCLPFNALEDLYQQWYGGAFMCKFVKFLQNASVLGSIMWLAALSVERRLAIRTSINKVVIQQQEQRRKVRAASLIIWSLAILLSIPMPIISEMRERQDDDGPRCSYVADFERFAAVYEYIFLFGLMICLPILVISVMHVKVAAILFKRFNIVTSESKKKILEALNAKNLSPQDGSETDRIASRSAKVSVRTGTGSGSSDSGKQSIDELRKLAIASGLITDQDARLPFSNCLRTLNAWKRSAHILIILVFVFASSYLPFCIVTISFKLMENVTIKTTWCGNSPTSHQKLTNSRALENETCQQIDTPIGASWFWKPCFLFARLIFYVSPTVNPLIFYVISRQLRRAVKCYAHRFAKIFSRRNEKLQLSNRQIANVNVIELNQRPQQPIKPILTNSKSSSSEGNVNIHERVNTKRVITLTTGYNKQWNYLSRDRRCHQDMSRNPVQQDFTFLTV